MSDLRSGGRPRAAASPTQSTVRPLPPRSGAATRPIPVGSAASEPATPGRTVVARKPRPDPGPLRIAIGLTGMATASALISAFLAPSIGASGGAGTSANDATVAAAPSQAVQHITRYVQLAPGQTAPPQAVVQQAPAPKPRVVIVTTKQSGG